MTTLNSQQMLIVAQGFKVNENSPSFNVKWQKIKYLKPA